MVKRFRNWEAARQQQVKDSSSHHRYHFDNRDSTEEEKYKEEDFSVAGARGKRPRQLIVAVTANGAECGECGENGFDEICPKPLTKTDIHRIVNRFFQ